MFEAEMMKVGQRGILQLALFLAAFDAPPLAPARTVSADRSRTGKIDRRNN
jgi:hypothetical protein